MVVLTFGIVVTHITAPLALSPRAEKPGHHLRDGFRNISPDYVYPLLGRALRAVRRGFEHGPVRGQAPVVLANNGAELRANGTAPTVTWIGHSTFLVQMDGVNILTDPNWSNRASPVGFTGPRRLVKPWLASAGITNAVELDRWETRKLRGLTLVCTPAQHSSGRGLSDQNRRLWASWAVLGPDRRLFFAGDTGYYPGFQEIGERLGPFDVAFIPIGGYSAYEHHPNHVNPEDAVQVFEDVRARLMVPMHYGTFDLNREPFREPPDRLLHEALRRGLEERIAILSPGQTIHW